MVKEETEAGTRRSLEPPDQIQQTRDQALLAIAGQLETAPAVRGPDLPPADDHLKRQERADSPRHVRQPSCWQGQSGNGEQQEGGAARSSCPPKGFDETADRLLPVAGQSGLELIAQRARRAVR